MPVVRRSRRGSDVAPHRAHAAVGVADAGAEEEVEDAGEHRVADVAVQPRHRARLDVLHPVAHHELRAVVELLDEARDVGEVVGQVGVGHHDVVAARRGEAGQVGAAVAAPRLEHDERAGVARDLGAAVVGAVVGDDRPRPASRCPRAPRARSGRSARSIAASFRHGITTETLMAPASSRSASGKPGCLLDCAQGNEPAVGGWSNLMNARRWKKSRALRGDGSERSGRLRAPHADLPRLRLPVPVHRRRRRALVPQPRPSGSRPTATR